MHNIVVNTTPLISLCHIGELNLLRDLYGTIIIPKAVKDEIYAKIDSITKSQLEIAQDWIKVIEIKNKMAKTFYKSQLHDGEVEVMILGKELNAKLLIIDDKNAKKHAKYLGFNVTGTLGVLLKAKKEGHILHIKPILEELRTKGIFLDNKTIAMCLREAGELES